MNERRAYTSTRVEPHPDNSLRGQIIVMADGSKHRVLGNDATTMTMRPYRWYDHLRDWWAEARRRVSGAWMALKGEL